MIPILITHIECLLSFHTARRLCGCFHTARRCFKFLLFWSWFFLAPQDEPVTADAQVWRPSFVKLPGSAEKEVLPTED